MPCYPTRMARRTCPSYVEGIRLYSEAKADFDGVIEQLKYDLNEGSDPKNSLHFGQVLNAAGLQADRVYRLCTQKILGNVQGARPGLPDVIAAVERRDTSDGGSAWGCHLSDQPRLKVLRW